MNFYFDPLAQFEVFAIISIVPGFVITNYAITLLLIMTFTQFMLTMSFPFFNNFLYAMTQNSLRFVNKILNDNFNLKRSQYFLVMYFLFIFILVANFIGLLPFAFAATSSFVTTFFLAFAHFFMLNFVAVWEKKENYFSLFLPSGVPFILAPLIVLIEIVSYFSRIFSLSIRLFANISSGHALLKILIGFSWGMLNLVLNGNFFNTALMLIAFLFPWGIVTLIFFLEILIAFLQSYVFIILLSIYINDVTTDEH